MTAASEKELTILRRCLFLVSLPLFFITFGLPVQSRALGASALEIGGLFSLFTFSILLMRPIVGYAMDRLGRRVFFLCALVFYISAYLGYTLASSIDALYIARFFQGIGATLLLLTVDTMTTDLAPTDERGHAMGRNTEFQTRASVVGATIGFTLVALVPELAWQLSFGVFAVLALFAYLYAWFRLPESRARQAELIQAPQAISTALVKLLVVFALLGMPSALILPIYLIYLQDTFTADPRMLSWAFLPAAFVFMLLPSRLGALADRHNPRALIMLGMLIAGLLYLAMPTANSFWMLVLIYSLSVIGWSLIEPCRRLLTAKLAPVALVARTFGLAEMAFGLGVTAGPLIGGYLYDHVSPASPFYFSGGVMLLTALLAIWLLAEKPASRDGH